MIKIFNTVNLNFLHKLYLDLVYFLDQIMWKDLLKDVERLRDNNLKTTLATLDNPNATVLAKKQAAEKYNSIVKGLRGQLKGTNVQGFVNFETFDVEQR